MIPSVGLSLIIMALFVVGVYVEDSPVSWKTKIGTKTDTFKQHENGNVVDVRYMVPKPLLDQHVYDEQVDFVNPKGKRPTYWRFNSTLSWGPCIPPLTKIPQWKDRRNETTTTNGLTLVWEKGKRVRTSVTPAR